MSPLHYITAVCGAIRRRSRHSGHTAAVVLQLADGLQLVWRTPHSVQLGVDPRRVIFDRVDAPFERLLSALATGVSRTGFDMMARAAALDPDGLLERLAPALASPEPTAPVGIVGAGPLADELRRQLGDSADPRLVVLVADWVVAPEDHGSWLRRDIPHLPVVAGDGGIEVGPLVVPGSGPCLYCVHLARADADPAWPAIATQLWGRPAPRLTRTAVVEAAAFAARRVASPSSLGTSWWIDAHDGAVSERVWERHPECRCAAPPESDWAPAADRAVLRATS